MFKAKIVFKTDDDVDLLTPEGTFHAYQGDPKPFVIQGLTENDLRRNIVWFLAQVEVRFPYADEYHYMKFSDHDGLFKFMLFEAIHHVASGGNLHYHCGGNKEIYIDLIQNPQ